MRTITISQARRIALRAQGFSATRSRAGAAPAGVAAMRATLRKIHQLQIDSVNVLVRAHYLPLFSRLGPYDITALDALAYRKRALFEYWGHAASLIATEHFPLLRWRMTDGDEGAGWKGGRAWGRANTTLVDAIYDEVAARGAIGISDLSHSRERTGPWWGWGDGKTALEYLFWVGRLSVAGRRNFERIYDLTERVIPREILAARVPARDEAERSLIMLAARAHGIATARDLADYFGLSRARAAGHVAELMRRGEIEQVRVAEWKDPAFVLPGTRAPREIDARALLSPFDPIMWERGRPARLFGFEYTIEIYVPAPKRVYGYYVLPVLLGDEIVARVDLKADRARSTLLVLAAYAEPGADRARVARALAAELQLAARWLGLGDISVSRKGDLAQPLRRALG